METPEKKPELKAKPPTTLEEMCATPKGIMIQGVEHELPPLTADRTAEFTRWYRRRQRAEHMQAALSLNLKGADKLDVLQSFKMPDTLEVFSGMTQPDGLVYIIWLSLRDKYPALTEAAIGAAITIPQASQAAQDLLAIEETRKELEAQEDVVAGKNGKAAK